MKRATDEELRQAVGAVFVAIMQERTGQSWRLKDPSEPDQPGDASLRELWPYPTTDEREGMT